MTTALFINGVGQDNAEETDIVLKEILDAQAKGDTDVFYLQPSNI